MNQKTDPIIYLNNAATTWPKPPGVLAAMNRSLAVPFFSGRTTSSQGEDHPARAREAISRILGADSPEHVIFTQNATDSLNILIEGLISRENLGCHALTSALDHNSVLRPLHEYTRQNRIKLTVVPLEGYSVLPETVESSIRPDTRFMVMTHGSNVLGSVQDIACIGDILHDHGIYFIVDGAQTAGHIPIDIRNLPVDCYVFTGHKGLFGIPGTGGFYIKEPDKIPPVRFGGTGTDSSSLYQPLEMPERFETGTHNYPGLAALAAGVEFIESAGIVSIAEKAKKQTSYLIREFQKEPGILLYNDEPELPIVSFNIRNLDNDDVGFILARAYGIIARTGLHCAPLVHQTIDEGKGCVRLSLSWFTTDEECRKTAIAVREIAQHANSSISQT